MASRLALVLGGGNALGAYHVGVVEALRGEGMVPDWLVGTSIGAASAALLAGGPPEGALDRLVEYWRRAASPGGEATGPLRRPSQFAGALQARLLGRPAMFLPHLFGRAGRPETVGLYDVAPFRRTLEELIDFDRLNGGPVRLSIVAVDVESGEEVVFDTRRTRIGVDHLLASAALIPDFSPVRVDGRLLVDGGFADNVPVDVVLSERPEAETLVVAADPFPRAGPAPDSLLEASERQSDLSFACQTERTLRAQAALDALRRRVPSEAWDVPVEVVRVAYQGGANETAAKGWDYTEGSVARRRQAGRDDVQAALSARAARNAVARPAAGLTLHPLVLAARAEDGRSE